MSAIMSEGEPNKSTGRGERHRKGAASCSPRSHCTLSYDLSAPCTDPLDARTTR